MSIVARDLRSARPAELLFRAHRRLRAATGAQRREFPANQPTDRTLREALGDAHYASIEAWRTHLSSRRGAFFFDPPSRPAYQSALQRDPPSDERANAIREGAVCFFGSARTLPKPVDWHRDPLSGARYPCTHWSNISITGNNGDVRAVWEINRQRDLFILGRAYWRTGDERYARAAAGRLQSWLAENPPETGVNWWSNLEIAVRSTAWCWALHFFADSAAFDGPLVWRLTAARAVVRATYREGFDVHEAMHARQSRDRRCRRARHHRPDVSGIRRGGGLAGRSARDPRGGGSETGAARRGSRRAVAGLSLFVWELLFGSFVLADKRDLSLPETRLALRRMARAAVLIATPDGGVPRLGDDDEAVVWDLGDDVNRVGAIAALAVAALELPELRPVADLEAEELVWLLGPDTASAVRHRTADRSEPSTLPTVSCTAFGCAARSSWSRLADHWIVRSGGLSKHTHADALNLLLQVNGEPCLIDSGTYTYEPDGGWRRFFRGTGAHNTVRIDGRDQADAHRSFRWTSSMHSIAAMAASEPGGLLLSAEHDGYARRGVRHRRQVLWLSDVGWLVVDRLDGRGEHRVELNWHLPSDARETQSGAVMACGSDSVELTVERFGALTHCRASHDPPRGWTSPRYGRIAPALTVTAKASLRLPCAFVSAVARVRPSGGLRIGRITSDLDEVGVALSDGLRTVRVIVGARHWRRLDA